MSSEYDINPPPRTIWDPPPITRNINRENDGNSTSVNNLDEDDTDRGTLQWSNQAMRVQLWDTFRLARIILEEPVKSHRLTSHLILHAIRKVAEMKLRISMLQRERNEAQKKAENEMITLTELKTVPETNVAAISPLSTRLVFTPSTTNHYQSSSDNNAKDLEKIFHETCEDLEQYERATNAMIIKSKSSPETTNTATTCGSTVDGEGLEPTVVGNKEEVEHVQALQREILSQPSLQHHQSSPPTLGGDACNKSLSSKPTAEEYTKLLRLQSQKQHQEIKALLQDLDSKVQETSQATTDQIKLLHAKLADAQKSQHVEALPQQEQHRQSGSRQPTSTEAHSTRMANQQLAQRHQQEVDVILRQLQEQVRETSEHTSEQIHALYEILQHAKIQQQTIHDQALRNLQQQLFEQEQASKHHLDVMVLKYLQTEENLQQELTKTREKLKAQLDLVEEWERKYYQLQGTIVPPAEVQAVLNKVQTLNMQLHADSTTRDTTKDIPMNRLEIAQVNQEVIELLSTLVTKGATTTKASDPTTTHTPPPAKILVELKHAKEKEAATLDELDFLMLQKELLVEDTTKVTVEQYAEMTAQGNELYQRELTAILEAEGRRLQEIDTLEAELNHLAFVAVQIEECERDFRRQQELYQQSINELRALNQSSTAKIQALQSHLQQTVEDQVVKVVVVGEEGDTKLSAADLRIHQLEQALAQRDAQLESTRMQLKLSQDRVRLLETTITSQ